MCQQQIRKMKMTYAHQNLASLAMVVGYSLSPGGLLLPYHLGVLDALQFHNRLDRSNPVAGSSAGTLLLGCRMDSCQSFCHPFHRESLRRQLNQAQLLLPFTAVGLIQRLSWKGPYQSQIRAVHWGALAVGCYPC
jgi:hypothetical protein